MCFGLPNINREGYSFIVVSFIVTCIAFSISWGFGVTCLFPTLLCTYFFRDPARAVPNNKDLILSPADGVISKIEEVNYPLSAENGEEKKFTLVSISAMSNRSSNENEKQVIVIEYEKGKEIIVEQIAGLIARRIVCNLGVSQNVKTGERFGIIRFGSRVNIYVPADIEVRVSEGQTVIGGETIIANLNKENVQEKLTFDVI